MTEEAEFREWNYKMACENHFAAVKTRRIDDDEDRIHKPAKKFFLNSFLNRRPGLIQRPGSHNLKK